jgi:protein phosphatase 2C family protein 2/3
MGKKKSKAKKKAKKKSDNLPVAKPASSSSSSQSEQAAPPVNSDSPTKPIVVDSSSGMPANETVPAIQKFLREERKKNKKDKQPSKGEQKKSGRNINVSIVRPTTGPKAKGNSSTSSASSKDELRWTGWGSPNLSSGSFKEKTADSESISASDGGDERLTYGVASLTGRRQTNEDEYVALLNMGFKKEKVGLFAVFDGHGGPAVSKMLEKEMPRMLKSRTKTPNEAGLRKAIKEVFLDVDEKIIRRKMKGGSTGVVAMVTDDKLIVGSVGDSRCLVCDNGKKYEMTRDHEIDDSEEEERILQAGYRPYIDSDNELRIEGLNMSRSFGDIELKKNVSLGMTEQAVIAVPRIRSMELRSTLEFMVVACDGVFEVMTNQDVVSYVRKALKSRTAEATACGLAKKAIKKGSNDNVSVIVVNFMRNNVGLRWKAPPPPPAGDSSSSDAPEPTLTLSDAPKSKSKSSSSSSS